MVVFVAIKWIRVLIPLSILFLGIQSKATESDGDPKNYSKSLIIVSTVDGKVSALEAYNGNLIWSIDSGQGPLISSSISKLVYNEAGKPIRLIPSLHGELYKFDGEGVEAVPFDVDQLLLSSFRLSEDTILVGGRETSTSGVNAFSGRVLYSCNASGCVQQESVQESQSVIIIKRQQQTVRSIENRNGHESWNFSAGEINISFSQGKPQKLLEGSGSFHSATTEKFQDKKHCFSDDGSEPFETCHMELIKVIVPDGTVCMVEPKNKHRIKWKHKFKNPISTAWLLHKDQLFKLNLFDPARVPALEDNGNNASPKDTIYMGTYKETVYIQAPPSVQKAVTVSAQYQLTGSTQVKNRSPRFEYKPLSANSHHLTDDDDDVKDADDLDADEDSNKLMVYDRRLKKGGGYYLQGDVSYLSRIQNSKKHGRDTVNSYENESFNTYNIEIVYSSVMHWWKELLILTVSVSIFVQCLIAKIMQVKSRFSGHAPTQQPSNEQIPDLPPSYSQANINDSVFESRFSQDFEPLECLGRGGFGIVFKAKNKMDDCEYAVKRILLPNNLSAREKVLREVRALAKLEHPSIVRYYNAWSETPPPEWQKQHDQSLLKDLSVWSQTPYHQINDTEVRTTANTGHHHDANICDSHLNASNKESGHNSDRPSNIENTVGFTILHDDETTDHSWLGVSNNPTYNQNLRGKFFQSESFSDTTNQAVSESNWNNSSLKVPFKHYDHQDSLSVVFDDDDGYSSRQVDTQSALFGCCESKNGSDSHDSSPLSIQTALRKRSSSPKRFDRTPSLKEVICTKESQDNPKEQTENKTATKNHPERTIYLYIQMQLCRKESLREWLVSDSSNRDRSVCVDVFQQVVSAVTYIHDQGLIHRDLKPSNVFFSLDEKVKVGDFGLVKHVCESEEEIEELNYQDTFPGDRHTQQVGTKMYMAPEQMSSSNYCEKVDIYALGLILFELINTFGTQMERIKHLTDARKLKFPNKFLQEYPQESCLTQAMLSQQPSARPTALEVADDDLFAQIESKTNRTRTSSSRSSDSFSRS